MKCQGCDSGQGQLFELPTRANGGEPLRLTLCDVCIYADFGKPEHQARALAIGRLIKSAVPEPSLANWGTRPSTSEVTFRLRIDGVDRVATFVQEEKIRALLADEGSLGAFLRALRDGGDN